MKAELVVMAAGMGSRFGGLKQAAPIGPNGEMILDYSIYDAAKAGFSKAIIIIRKEIEEDFLKACGKRLENMIDIEYVYQEKDSLLDGYTLPRTRVKPWGTGHAILCAKDAVKNPFLVINADDYYGQSVYKTMFDYLTNNDGMCMAGFSLGNTLSENGTVSRGICTERDGYLVDIEEHTDIAPDTTLSLDTIVSMNMWGLDTEFFPYLEKEFKSFIKENINEPKKEFFLPSVINSRLKSTDKKVKILPTAEKWYGITYSEDVALIKNAISELTKKGLY